MTLPSGHKNKPPFGGGPAVGDGLRNVAAAGSDLPSSPHLDDILGRINTIITEQADQSQMAAADPYQSSSSDGRGDVFASSEPEYRPVPLSPKEAFQAGAEEGVRSFLEEAQNLSQGSSPFDAAPTYDPISQTPVDMGPLQGDGGFVASEPQDMVAPYSDALKEVRDYFNDRHSLDPNDGLLKPSERQSQFQQSQAPSMREPGSSFGRGGFEGADGFANPPVSAGDFYRQPVNGPDGPSQQVFSPLQFEQSLHPLAQRPDQLVEREVSSLSSSSLAPSSEVMAPDEVGAVKFRKELINRIARMEEVMGHHFADRNEIAQQAARSAVEMTLQNLDDSAMGQRLSELESSFAKYQNDREEKDQKTDAALQKIADVMTNSGMAPKADLLPGATNNRPGDPAIGAEEEARALSKTLSTVGRDVVESDGMPPPLGGANDHSVVDAATSEKLASAMTVEAVPLPQGREYEALADGNPIDELSEIFGSGSEEHGLSEKASDLQDKSKKTTNDLTGDRAGGKADAGTVEDMGDELVSKSSKLRAQFNQATIVSRDNDFSGTQRRGAKPAIVIVVVALLLATAGLVARNQSFDLQGFISQVIEKIKIVTGQISEANVVKGAIEGEKKSGDRELALGQELRLKRSKALDDGGDEINITGNIVPRTLNKAKAGEARLSDIGRQDGALDINPEDLLPSVDGKLTLPPALIGPYSLRLAAANGDVEAQYEVARRFSMGQGVPKDYDEAVRWYMHAAAKGFAPAQYRLATLYERGFGVPKDLRRAKVWYKRAAELGNVKAMHNLAVISTALNRDAPDYVTAVIWFKKAASLNLADSQFNLAVLYQSGVGVKKNRVEAYKWFSLAARQGDRDAARRRNNVEKSMSKAERLLVINNLQKWKPKKIIKAANSVGLKGVHIVSTMSHAAETVRRSRVLTAQILLRRLGYKVSEADGSLNEQTIVAIQKFEKKAGLPVTGKISQNLIKRLNKKAL